MIDLKSAQDAVYGTAAAFNNLNERSAGAWRGENTSGLRLRGVWNYLFGGGVDFLHYSIIQKDENWRAISHTFAH